MAANFPECPPSLKAINPYLKTALEHDARDVIVAYWCRLYALQLGLKTSSQSPDERKLLIHLMDWLEKFKKEHSENESITNDVAAQAYLENYALKLFLYADKQDRASNFGKNVVKAFYTSGIIYDLLQTFGGLTDEVLHNRKYAKWKAAYIHNCLKNGETPMPGPMQNEEDDEENTAFGENTIAPIPPNPNAGQEPYAGPSFGFASGFHPPPYVPTGNIITNDPFTNIKAPTPPSEPEKPPGGFQPYIPPNEEYKPPTNTSGAALHPEHLIKAQKYCKWAGSALNYEDVNTAIDNLQKALRLLQTGQDK